MQTQPSEGPKVWTPQHVTVKARAEATVDAAINLHSRRCNPEDAIGRPVQTQPSKGPKVCTPQHAIVDARADATVEGAIRLHSEDAIVEARADATVEGAISLHSRDHKSAHQKMQ